MTKMITLDSSQHKNLKVSPDPTHKHAGSQQMVPLLAAEFLRASIDYPIFFVKQQQTGRFKPVALMGTEANENLIFANGKIHAAYLPANLRRYPFAAGGDSRQSDELVICIDQDSSWLSKETGFALFDQEGKPTAELNQIGNLLVDMLAKDEATDNFVNDLVALDLIERADIKLNLAGHDKITLSGIYKVNEEKLNGLSSDNVLALHKKHYFAAIYAHLASINQINKLLTLKAEKLAEQ